MERAGVIVMPDQGLGNAFVGGFSPEDWMLSGQQPPESPYQSKYPVEPDLTQRQTGVLPEGYTLDDAGRLVHQDTGEPAQYTRRPNVSPLTFDPEGQPVMVMPKIADLLSNLMGGSVPLKGAEMALGAGPIIRRGAAAAETAKAGIVPVRAQTIGETAAEMARPPLVTPSREIMKPTPAETYFDYSKIHEIPDVPQFDLPRYEPARGVSERVQDLVANKDVYQGMLDYMERGKQIGAQNFYNTEELRQPFVDELGKRAGPQWFGRYMDFVSGSSPRSKVAANARNGSYYYMLNRQGQPMPEVGSKNPEPYGHMAQILHQMNARDIVAGNWDIIQKPKPPSFSTNLQGNFMPGTIDAHAFKGPAIISQDPRFLATSVKLDKGEPTIKPQQMYASGELPMSEAITDPKYWASKPNLNEYAAMEDYYGRLARDAGLPSRAQGQAAGWAGAGELTGLGSVAGDPFLKTFEDRLRLTQQHMAQTQSQTPTLDEVLSRFIRGNASLRSVGGGGALPLAYRQNEQQQYQ